MADSPKLGMHNLAAEMMSLKGSDITTGGLAVQYQGLLSPGLTAKPALLGQFCVYN